LYARFFDLDGRFTAAKRAEQSGRQRRMRDVRQPQPDLDEAAVAGFAQNKAYEK
jgi:hypothetical protein